MAKKYQLTYLNTPLFLGVMGILLISLLLADIFSYYFARSKIKTTQTQSRIHSARHIRAQVEKSLQTYSEQLSTVVISRELERSLFRQDKKALTQLLTSFIYQNKSFLILLAIDSTGHLLGTSRLTPQGSSIPQDKFETLMNTDYRPWISNIKSPPTESSVMDVTVGAHPPFLQSIFPFSDTSQTWIWVLAKMDPQRLPPTFFLAALPENWLQASLQKFVLSDSAGKILNFPLLLDTQNNVVISPVSGFKNLASPLTTPFVSWQQLKYQWSLSEPLQIPFVNLPELRLAVLVSEKEQTASLRAILSMMFFSSLLALGLGGGISIWLTLGYTTQIGQLLEATFAMLSEKKSHLRITTSIFEDLSQKITVLARRLKDGILRKYFRDEKGIYQLPVQSEKIESLLQKLQDIQRSSQMSPFPPDLLQDLMQRIERFLKAPLKNMLNDLFNSAISLAQSQSKKIHPFIAEGGQTEIHVEILQNLESPIQILLHQIVEFGSETASLRKILGKAEFVMIKVEILIKEKHLHILFTDDGCGLDLTQIQTLAVQQGLAHTSAAAPPSAEELVQIVLQENFTLPESLRQGPHPISYLKEIKEKISQQHGIFSVETQPNHSTTYSLILPETPQPAFEMNLIKDKSFCIIHVYGMIESGFDVVNFNHQLLSAISTLPYSRLMMNLEYLNRLSPLFLAYIDDFQDHLLKNKGRMALVITAKQDSILKSATQHIPLFQDETLAIDWIKHD